MENFTSPEQNVIENLRAVNLLRDVCNANSESIPVHSNELKPKQFSFEDLSNYISDPAKSEAVGGYSKVYRGKLDGMQVAIKVLENDDVAAESFTTEIETMVTASHPNLVKLHGYCFESNMKALVYEYMENGSLDKILFENYLNLEWGKLYRIALETAKGLAYLHDGCGKQIIHRDIKPANVLLDENLSAKITDFGVAKLLSTDANHYTITNNQGTPGYIAPEFGNPTSQITNKCDVYSFGVTLFEVLGKRKNGKFGPKWFPLQIWEKFEKGQLDELIESFGIPEIHKDKAKILSMAGFWCLQFTVDMRPSMSTVVEVLEKEISVNTPPYPFKENVPSPNITMLPSQEVILEIHSDASPVIQESLAPDLLIKAFEEEENKDEAEKYSDDEQAMPNSSKQALSKYSRSDIVTFTSNFSDLIGRGRFADDYKGQFLDGVKVSVRVLKDGDTNEEFFMRLLDEVNISHPHIVELHGYCFDAKLKALVYEYVENGSLDRILYMNHLHIKWEQLYEIAMETAKGISALHAVGFVDCDIKASNILLNSNLSPKIESINSLFCTRKVGNIIGTFTRLGIPGYSAPEKWIPTSVVTSKSDVYSFGMLLFEVLGRRRNGIGREWFPIQVWKMLNKGQLSKMIKDCGIKKKDREKANNLSMVAFWCAQFDPEKRPSMSRVLKMLQMEIPVMYPPNPFPFGGLDNHFFGASSQSGMELEEMLNLFEEKCPPGGEHSVVLYTRTVILLGTTRECNYVSLKLKSHQIEIFERDISANSAYRVELKELLGKTEVPALFVHGRFIGGVNEVKSLEEEGKLKKLLYGIPVERP